MVVSQADFPAERHQAVQLQYFDEDFAARNDVFTNRYHRINAERTYRAVDPGFGLRVLEVGPGTGALMRFFSSKGHDVTGLDLSPAVALAIQAKFGLPVATENLDAHLERVGVARYDLVLMCHVVEHMSDPAGAIHSVAALLKAGGRAYVAVPNMESWHSHCRGWSGYEPYHLHYFTRSSLQRLLSRAGFCIQRVYTYESLTGWPNTLLRSLRKELGTSAGVEAYQFGPKPKGSGFGRGVLESGRLAVGLALTPLRWAQAALDRGEELVCIAAKPKG